MLRIEWGGLKRIILERFLKFIFIFKVFVEIIIFVGFFFFWIEDNVVFLIDLFVFEWYIVICEFIFLGNLFII